MWIVAPGSADGVEGDAVRERDEALPAGRIEDRARLAVGSVSRVDLEMEFGETVGGDPIGLGGDVAGFPCAGEGEGAADQERGERGRAMGSFGNTEVGDRWDIVGQNRVFAMKLRFVDGFDWV